MSNSSGRSHGAVLHQLAAVAAVLHGDDADGLMGLLVTPRQEDPQISVPMVDIFVSYPGARTAGSTWRSPRSSGS